jgi:hypothetical protein
MLVSRVPTVWPSPDQIAIEADVVPGKYILPGLTSIAGSGVWLGGRFKTPTAIRKPAEEFLGKLAPHTRMKETLLS